MCIAISNMEVEPLTAENSTLKEISISIFPVSIVQAKLQEFEYAITDYKTK